LTYLQMNLPDVTRAVACDKFKYKGFDS
jgi:hypothetical protein